MKVRNTLFIGCLLLSIIACKQEEKTTFSGLKTEDFQTEEDGKLTALYVLKNEQGMEVCVTNYGARIVSIMAPDRYGKMEDLVNGFSNINDYINIRQNFGATIGRYIGRILNATFTLDSITYHLDANTGPHTGHGGHSGFAYKIWQGEQLNESAVKFSYLSVDGESGFPGNLNVHVVYRLTEKNEVDIMYEAYTDKPTVVNLSHHSFFNLSGDLSTTIEDEVLYVNADYYTPYDSTKCVTGEFASVAGTPLDFTAPRRIGDRIDEDFMQLNITGGYDHCWVLNTEGDITRVAASLYDEKSGRMLEVYTDEPGLQVYTANGLKGAMVGKQGIAYPKRNSICLETMHFQDSPNKPQFPSTVLRPGEVYYSRCIYKFSVK